MTMSNSGDQPLTISAIATSGAHPQDFQLGQAQARTIPPGQSSTFTVAFLPRAAGERTAIVRIESNSSSGPVEIPVTGRGATRVLEITPDRLSFGDQRIRASSDELALSIASVGSDPVKIRSVTGTGEHRSDFTVRGPGAVTLDPGEDAIASVTFRPSAVGRRVASITIESDACVGRMMLAVDGNGTAPDLEVHPSRIEMGRAPVGTRSDGVPVVISNGGRAPLRITRIVIEGDAPADFLFESLPSTPKILGPAGEIPLSAVFAPTKDGPRTAILRIDSDDPDTPVMRVELRGNVTDASASPPASPSASGAASPSPSRLRASPTLAPRRTAGPGRGGAGDWIAIAVVMLAGGGTFGGLFAIARRRSAEE